MKPETKAALERLIAHAKRDTDQSRRIAYFLLAWRNAGTCDSFDLANLWAVDDDIRKDMTTVFAFIGAVKAYPDSLGYSADFDVIVHAWQPEMATPEDSMPLKRFALVVAPAVLVAGMLGATNPETLPWWTVAALAIVAGAIAAIWELMSLPHEG